MKLRIFFLICGLALSASGQIDLKEIMKGYDFIGYSPENIAWNLQGDGVYFTKKYDENGSFSTFFLDFKTKRIDTVTKPYWSFSDAYLQHSKGYYLTNGFTLVNFDGKKVDTVFTSSKYLRLLDVQGEALFFLWGADEVICYEGNSFRTQVKLVSKQRAHPKSSQEVWLEEQQNMLAAEAAKLKVLFDIAVYNCVC